MRAWLFLAVTEAEATIMRTIAPDVYIFPL